MKYLGTEFIWWFGVVEDRNDPLQLGRVRVRSYGYHTDDKNAIPCLVSNSSNVKQSNII